MLNMSSMSVNGFSPLGYMHNVSILDQEFKGAFKSYHTESDPFKKLSNFIQSQIQKPHLKNEHRIEIILVLSKIKNPNFDELKILINKILVLQKYCEPDFQVFLRNIVLYELENIKTEIQNVESYKHKHVTNEFMKKRPSLAKNVKPGKKNNFNYPEDDIELVKSVDFNKEYTDYKNTTIK